MSSDHQSSVDSKRSPARAAIGRLTSFCTLFVLVPTLLACFANHHWVCELFAQFRVQYCLLLLPAIAATFFFKCRLTLAFCLIGLVVNLIPIAPYLVPADSRGDAGGKQTYRLLSFNVLTSNRDYENVLDQIRNSQSDFAILMEPDGNWNRQFQKLKSEFPHQHFEPQGGNFGIAFLSKHPWESIEVMATQPLELPSLVIDLQIEQQPVRIIATHPIPPMDPMRTQARDDQLLEMAGHVHSEMVCLMAGDFNLTPWSPRFGKVLEAGGLSDASVGMGWASINRTWQVFPTLLGGLKIDHILVNPKVRPVNFEVYDEAGSDHRAICLEFFLD